MIPLLALLVLQSPVPVFKGPVTSVAMLSDGKVVASGEGGAAIVGGTVVRRFLTQFPKAHGVALTSDESLLFVVGGVAGESGGVEVFDFATGARQSEASGHYDSAMSVAVLSSRKWVATGGADAVVRVYEYGPRGATLRAIAELNGHSGPVLCMGFLPGGDLVTAGRDGTLRVWDVATGALLRSLSFHTGPVNAVAFPGLVHGTPWCATASDDRTVRVWQPGIGRMVRILRGADAPLLSLAMVPDGSRLLVGGSDGLVRLLPSDGGDPLATWTVKGEWATSLGVSWNGKRAAVGASDGSVRFIDLP